MPIDLADLQGNVLCGYGHSRAAYRFCRVDDAVAGRAWLAALAPQVTSATPWTTRPERTLNVALSHSGLRALSVPEAVLAQLPSAFRAGMAARAERLGDRGADAPAHWDPGLDDQRAHVLLTVYADGTGADALDRALAAVPVPAGVSVLATERAALLPGGREHFGFADGLAQPAVDDPVAGPYDGQGTPHRRNRRTPPVDRWRPIAPGEFILGYPDEDGDVPGGPAPLDRNATFMVVRKLAQDVGMWERQLRRWSGGDPALGMLLAARQVGRWPNGTPVARRP
ncbi:MAG: peroxidase, partial [Solirubrobacterales bacterium]|nr:peroxidase [Solirubrobacterales bacterium]